MKKFQQFNFSDNLIEIDTPSPLNLFQLKQFLPNITLSSDYKKSNILITFEESIHNSIEFSLHYLKIKSNWNETWLTDFPHLIYSYLKYVLFHQNKFFIHSCLINQNLFIGHSGSGKTTLCINALEKNLLISSSDKTIVFFENDCLQFLNGTDVLSVRKNSSQPDLPLLISNNDRNLYSLNTEKQNIKNLVLFQINSNNHLNKINNISKTHELFNFFMDSLKNDCFLQNGQMLFSPFYSENLKIQLFQKIKNLKNKLYFKSGNINYILEDIL